jgi:hypothetical protein
MLIVAFLGVSAFAASSWLVSLNRSRAQHASATSSPYQPYRSFRKIALSSSVVEGVGEIRFAVETDFWHGDLVGRWPDESDVRLKAEVFAPIDTRLEHPISTIYSASVHVPEVIPTGGWHYQERVPFQFDAAPSEEPYHVRVTVESVQFATQIESDGREVFKPNQYTTRIVQAFVH